MNEREQLRKALEDISAMTYDSWTNGARAKEIADAALSTPQADKVPAAEGASLPHPGSPEASAMMDSMLAEYQYPSNPKNAARAGYEAARRMLATPPAKLPQEAQPVAQWQKRHPVRTDGEWENTHQADAKWWRDNAKGWEIRALYAAPQPARAVPQENPKPPGVTDEYWRGWNDASYSQAHDPQPARAGAVESAKDAARYRWLREQHQGHEDMQFDFEGFPLPQEPTALAWTVFKPDRGELVPVGCIVGELDDAIDAAIAAATTAATGEKEQS